jgi:hypothetical protein
MRLTRTLIAGTLLVALGARRSMLSWPAPSSHRRVST